MRRAGRALGAAAAFLRAAWSAFMAKPWAAAALGWLALFIIALAVFAYVRFPAETLVPAIERAAREKGMSLKAKRARLSFPPGVTMQDVTVGAGEELAPFVSLGTLTLRPSTWAALRGGEGGSADARGLGGRAGARFARKDGRVTFSLDIEDMDPGQAQWWSQFPWGKLSGALWAEAAVEWEEERPAQASGKLQARITGGTLTLNKKVFPDFPSAAIETGELEAVIENGAFTITSGRVAGPDFTLTLDGGATLAPSPLFSRLNIKGKLTLSPRLENGLGVFASASPKDAAGARHFALSGTLARPVRR